MRGKTLVSLFIILLVSLSPIAFIFAENTTSTADLLKIIEQLQAQIKQLEAQIVELKAQMEAVKIELKFTRALQRGEVGEEVKELQEFLKQFPDIYPEGLVTGYFGPLTEAAVKRFQEKQGIEPLGMVGPKTMAKLNEIAAATPTTPVLPFTPTPTPTTPEVISPTAASPTTPSITPTSPLKYKCSESTVKRPGENLPDLYVSSTDTFIESGSAILVFNVTNKGPAISPFFTGGEELYDANTGQILYDFSSGEHGDWSFGDMQPGETVSARSDVSVYSGRTLRARFCIDFREQVQETDESNNNIEKVIVVPSITSASTPSTPATPVLPFTPTPTPTTPEVTSPTAASPPEPTVTPTPTPTPTTTCVDTDGGVSPYVMGRVELSTDGILTTIAQDLCTCAYGDPTCMVNPTLHEAFCNSDGTLGYQDITCPNGCKSDPYAVCLGGPSSLKNIENQLASVANAVSQLIKNIAELFKR